MTCKHVPTCLRCSYVGDLLTADLNVSRLIPPKFNFYRCIIDNRNEDSIYPYGGSNMFVKLLHVEIPKTFDTRYQCSEHAIGYSATNDIRGGFKGGQGGHGPLPREKSGPPVASPTARSKVNDAGILLNYVVIASNVNDVLCLLCLILHLYRDQCCWIV